LLGLEPVVFVSVLSRHSLCLAESSGNKDQCWPTGHVAQEGLQLPSWLWRVDCSGWEMWINVEETVMGQLADQLKLCEYVCMNGHDVCSHMSSEPVILLYCLFTYLEVITWLFSYRPVFQARASITAQSW